jgi:heterodisulfide reductase subunit A-like polyferredoxin
MYPIALEDSSKHPKGYLIRSAANAIHVVDGLATVDYLKFVGCGACAKACPRRIISIIPFKADRVLSIS